VGRNAVDDLRKKGLTEGKLDQAWERVRGEDNRGSGKDPPCLKRESANGRRNCDRRGASLGKMAVRLGEGCGFGTQGGAASQSKGAKNCGLFGLR